MYILCFEVMTYFIILCFNVPFGIEFKDKGTFLHILKMIDVLAYNQIQHAILWENI